MIFNRKKILGLSLILAMFSSPAFAEPSAGTTIYASAGIKGDYGSAYSKDKVAVVSRTLYVPALDGVLGLRLSKYFIVGAGLEYAFWRQQTDPDSIKGSNIQGTMLNVTPTVGVQYGGFRFLVRYLPLVAKYNLDKPNAAGQNEAYKDANILNLQMQFQMAGSSSYFGFEFSKDEFKKISINGTDTTLSDSSRAEFQSFGVTYGFAY